MSTDVFRQLLSILIVATLVFSICSCEKIGVTPTDLVEQIEVEEQPSSPAVTFPITRSLKNKRGKEIQAKIIGRNVAAITFLRQPDNRRFTTPIDAFSEMDQRFLRGLPLTVAKKHKRVGNTRPSSVEDSGFSSFIDSRNKEIKELEEEIEEFWQILRTNPVSSQKYRTAQSNMNKLRRKVNELRSEVREFERMNR